MKKIYMTPKAEMVKTELEQMISVSPIGTNVPGGAANPEKEVLSKEHFVEDIQTEGAEESLW
jgi:hypothetical protein